ncbi:MAG TPA: ABC transporter substrate-binding protein [Acidimicrobiia bacterium]|nr:ABC transporter substrate-binding protein [Acidimicrobiia bacterium]
MSRRPTIVVIIIALAVALAACGSSSKSNASKTPTTTAASGSSAFPVSTTVSQGITNSTIKVGVSLIDYTCLPKSLFGSIRVNQDVAYRAYFTDINQHGGIDGRQIVPVFATFCPVGSITALRVCTKFTEDDKVFAVMGTMFDTSGDAQTCVAKRHNVPLVTFDLTQAIMDKSPPGLIIFAGPNPERIAAVVLQLAKQEGTLNGKTVAVLAESTSASRVKSTIEPALKAMPGVKTGSTAYISVGSSQDTTAQQAQLDAFIERWKSESVNAVFIAGTALSSTQFVDEITKKMPGVLLLTDSPDALNSAQAETQAGKNPNPYQGMLTAVGPTQHEYDNSANWAYCSKIYQQQTGKPAPNGEQVVKQADGTPLDTYGNINDACQLVTLFHDIMVKVGKYPNVPNWQYVVDRYGPITNRGGGQYASLTKGKYDIDDTFRLVEFDTATGGPKGGWKPLTPIYNITGTGG